VKITEIHGEKAAIVRRNCHREVSTLSKLNHPCIVKLHETFKAKNTFCLVMEYVDGGDLLTFVREKPEGKLVEEDARWYFEQIVSVLDYLHQRFIVHRYVNWSKNKLWRLIDT
jgi:serine/threonine protein kinase